MRFATDYSLSSGFAGTQLHYGEIYQNVNVCADTVYKLSGWYLVNSLPANNVAYKQIGSPACHLVLEVDGVVVAAGAPSGGGTWLESSGYWKSAAGQNSARVTAKFVCANGSTMVASVDDISMMPV